MRLALILLLVWIVPGLAFGQSPSEKRATADKLLNALKAAPNSAAASLLEDNLRQLWVDASTPAVTLLMRRGLRELQAGANNDAADVFTDAITLDATLAEAWHQRAIARYQAGNTPGAISDLQETVKREPRNFAAWKTLAEIAAAREDWKGAYAAWQKVMELDPKTPGGDERLLELKHHALGENA